MNVCDAKDKLYKWPAPITNSHVVCRSKEELPMNLPDRSPTASKVEEGSNRPAADGSQESGG